MSKLTPLLTGTTGIATGVVAAGAVVVASYVGWTTWIDPPAPVASPEQIETVSVPVQDTVDDVVPETSTVEEAALAAPEPEVTDDAVKEAVVPEAATPEVEEPPAQAIAEIIIPEFDLVRVETDGSTLVAGQAAPDGEIAILLDDQEIARAQSDGTGKFVSFINIAPSTQPQVLSLQDVSGDAVIASAATVIIAPSLTEIAEVETALPGETATAPLEVDLAEVEDTEAPTVTTEEEEVLAAVEETAEPEPATAPVVLLSDASGVRVLQTPEPTDPAPDLESNVAIDAITYSDDGEVQLAGRGEETEFVRVYLDNEPVTTSKIEEDGNWATQLPDVDTGVYTLRVDQVGEDGNVTSRVETPFKREDGEQLAALQGGSTAAVRSVIVQPGNTLWAIARDAYGEGPLYVRVFEANKGQIRNPDLIYPGQVFAVPE